MLHVICCDMVWPIVDLTSRLLHHRVDVLVCDWLTPKQKRWKDGSQALLVRVVSQSFWSTVTVFSSDGQLSDVLFLPLTTAAARAWIGVL